MLYWEYYLAGIILIPGIILAIWAEIKVSNAFSKYGKVLLHNNLEEDGKVCTGANVAKMILEYHNIYDVDVKSCRGNYSDNYNPQTKTVNLSDEVYNKSTVLAAGVAAHEVGHAIQHSENSFMLRLRNFVVVTSNITNKLLWPIVVLGLILGFAVNSPAGKIVLVSGIIVFGLSFLFSLITLPVEINASKKAMANLEAMNVFTDSELDGVSKVLKAAAYTYLAGMVMSLLELIRFIMVFRDRD